MKANKKISIIIPAYNSEKHIDKCLSSIICQTYTDFEVIIVNDGSSDNTESIILKYAEADSRIKPITIENSGPSFAKNVGIDIADGEYITFVDSDDYISKQHLQLLYDLVKNNDYSVSGLIDEDDSTKVISKTKIISGKKTNNELINDMILSKNAIGGYCCNKLYKTSIIKSNDIKFVSGHKYMFEDLLFNFEYLKHTANGNCENECTYHYVHHMNEGMSRGLDDIEDKWTHYTDILDFILEKSRDYDVFTFKIKMAKVWHSATAVRVLAHYKRKETDAYKKMHSYIGKNLFKYLRYNELPLKKRIGAVITFFFPELSFNIWNISRS